MAGITISYSDDRFDQWRLSKSGGHIAFKKGKPVFQFDNFDQYQKYMALNSERNKESVNQ